MCGIAGFIGRSNVPASRVAACRELMTRRGPDADGYFEAVLNDGTCVQLLHSRLSILDLDARSNQPLSTGHSSIAMNGEIYNYLELRDELLAAGVEFKTTGDTEVAVVLLEQLGPSALARFEAMFALAWVDQTNDTVVLARDQFGEKPLLLLKTEDGVYFGSEVQYLRALSGECLHVNEGMLARFLVNGYKDVYKHPETFFHGVSRVAAGEALVRSAGGDWHSESRRPGEAIRLDETLTFQEAVDETLRRVIHATDLRLRADVPVALCLSGGIDSNLLMGVARNVLEKDVQTFSIVGSDPRYDETEAILASAKWFGIEPHIKTMTGFDALEVLEEVTRERGAPVATANQFALWSLMQEISASGYKVAISGLGADELFSGYYDHHLYYLFELAQVDDRLAQQRKGEWEQTVLPLVRNPAFRVVGEDPRLYPTIPALIFGDVSMRKQYLSPGLQAFSLEWSEELLEDDLLRNRLANELWYETVPLTLHEEDHNAMYWSVENRSPYLDTRLLAWSRTVPTRYFIRNGRAKALLRAAGSGIVPDSVLHNPRKTGFNLSVTDLLPADRNRAIDYVADSPMRNFLDLPRIASLMHSNEFSDSDNKFAFAVLACAAFTRVFG